MREKIFSGEYLHLYLRGVKKEDIFLDQLDYQRFMILLKHCNKKDSEPLSVLFKKKQTEIYASLSNVKEDYGNIIISTLMPNHFHILIQCLEDGSVGKYMQRVLTAFAKYFNNRHSEKGHKFENKYQYRKITNDYDLQNTIDYIYHNPAKLLDENYKHIDLINGKYKLSKKQKDFLKDYFYTYKGPSFPDYREKFSLNF